MPIIKEKTESTWIKLIITHRKNIKIRKYERTNGPLKDPTQNILSQLHLVSTLAVNKTIETNS